jgi:hypothetical protein
VELTPPVRSALDPAIEAVLQQLDLWDIAYSNKKVSSPLEVWWEPVMALL